MHGIRHLPPGHQTPVNSSRFNKPRRPFGDPTAALKGTPRFIPPPFTNLQNLVLPLEIALRDPGGGEAHRGGRPARLPLRRRHGRDPRHAGAGGDRPRDGGSDPVGRPVRPACILLPPRRRGLLQRATRPLRGPVLRSLQVLPGPHLCDPGQPRRRHPDPSGRHAGPRALAVGFHRQFLRLSAEASRHVPGDDDAAVRLLGARGPVRDGHRPLLERRRQPRRSGDQRAAALDRGADAVRAGRQVPHRGRPPPALLARLRPRRFARHPRRSGAPAALSGDGPTPSSRVTSTTTSASPAR